MQLLIILGTILVTFILCFIGFKWAMKKALNETKTDLSEEEKTSLTEFINLLCENAKNDLGNHTTKLVALVDSFGSATVRYRIRSSQFKENPNVLTAIQAFLKHENLPKSYLLCFNEVVLATREIAYFKIQLEEDGSIIKPEAKIEVFPDVFIAIRPSALREEVKALRELQVEALQESKRQLVATILEELKQEDAAAELISDAVIEE